MGQSAIKGEFDMINRCYVSLRIGRVSIRSGLLSWSGGPGRGFVVSRSYVDFPCEDSFENVVPVGSDRTCHALGWNG